MPGVQITVWVAGGCRGPADEANLSQLQEIMDSHSIPRQAMLDRLECFGGFTSAIKKMNK